jgi:3-mercaptopyruvate sulfurtransferase SseA
MSVRPVRAGAFVDKARVLEAIADPAVSLVDSLKAGSYSGAKASRYGRRGHITSALNVPYTALVNAATGQFHDLPTIRTAFESSGVRLAEGGEGRRGPPILAY